MSPDKEVWQDGWCVASRPRALLQTRFHEWYPEFSPDGRWLYDVTADGRRFLMVQQKERPAVSVSNMVLVQNWIEELKARVPTNWHFSDAR